jgi:hypothetical protein
MAAPATVTDFKNRFQREFHYGTTANKVMDADITNAINDALPLFNASLWASTEVMGAFLMAAAHFLALNIQAAGGLSADASASGGLDNAGGAPIQSRTVGPITLNYALPESITRNPILAQFMRTDFGCRYLQMASSRLVGNMAVVSGPNDTGAPIGP